MHVKTINTKDISIPYLFEKTTPNPIKVAMKKKYYNENEVFPKLVIRKDGLLLDGYASYIAAKEMKLETVKCTVLDDKEAIHYIAKQENYGLDQKKKKKRQHPTIKGECRCYICGRLLYKKEDIRYDGTNQYTIDHKIPLDKGGLNTPDNRFPCCNLCNGLKGDFTYSSKLVELILLELDERGIEHDGYADPIIIVDPDMHS